MEPRLCLQRLLCGRGCLVYPQSKAAATIGDGDIWREAGFACLCVWGTGGAYRRTADVLRVYPVKLSVYVRKY